MGKDLRARATAAPAQTGEQKPATLAQQIDRMQVEFQRAMPQGKEATQLVRDAQTALRQTRDLAKCEPSTVLGSLMTCAQLGLRPGVLGQAYVLPFWDYKDKCHKAQLIIGYQGLLELIYRSGLVETVAARVVYENDEFLLEYGLAEDKLVHRPPAGGATRGKAVSYYAIARMKGGGYQMTDPIGREDMEVFARENASAKKRDGTLVGPWVKHFDEMAKKTCVRALAKMLPKSPEVAHAITHDGAVRADTTPAALDQQPDYIDGDYYEGTPETEHAAAAAEESTPVSETVDNVPSTEDEPPLDVEPETQPDTPPVDDAPQDLREIVRIEAKKRKITQAKLGAWLQQALVDPDAPAAIDDLTDEQCREILSNLETES